MRARIFFMQSELYHEITLSRDNSLRLSLGNPFLNVIAKTQSVNRFNVFNDSEIILFEPSIHILIRSKGGHSMYSTRRDNNRPIEKELNPNSFPITVLECFR